MGIRFRYFERHAMALAEQREADGDEEGAQRARDRASLFAERSASHLADARQLVPDNPELVQFDFEHALGREDWDEAQAIVSAARESNVDQASGLLFKGRLEIARRDYTAAIQSLTEAKRVNTFSSTIRRLLGFSQERTGQLSDALISYGEAYARRPTDMATVHLYTALLIQTGDRVAALKVLSEARRVAMGNDAIWSMWLQLEAEAGDFMNALEMRRTLYREDPNDRHNALQLAALLARRTPKPEYISDPNGRLYDERRWGGLSTDQQRALLRAEQEAWAVEADTILEELDTDGPQLDTAMGPGSADARARSS